MERERIEVILYGDIFFILNFIMNLFLILITAMLRQKRCKWRRFLLIAALQAVLSLVFLYIFWGRGLLLLFSVIFQMAVMTVGAFGYQGLKELLWDSLYFAITTFFTGGVIGVLQQLCGHMLPGGGYFQPGFFGSQDSRAAWGAYGGQKASIKLILGAVCLLLCLFVKLRKELVKQGQRRKSCLRATVFHGGRAWQIRVLYDTGNQLVSPYSGEPVAVISKSLANELDLEKAPPLMIPYTSVGGSGLLRAYRIDGLLLESGQRRNHFLAAVSDKIHGEEIQMILNIT